MQNIQKTLQRAVLCFTISVVVVCAITFIFGGHCASWQWWVSVGLSVALCWWKSDKRTALWSVGLFLGLLALVWVFCNVAIGSGYPDCFTCHQTVIRLLINGWNPVWSGTTEKLLAETGISSDMFSFLHAIAMHKAVHYFQAVAYFFHHNPFNIILPLIPILSTAVFIQVWLTFREYKWYVKLLAALIIFVIMPVPALEVDAVVTLATMGLLLALWRIFRYNEVNGCALFCFSFWMCAAKVPSAMHCIVIWLSFFVLLLIRKRCLPVRFCRALLILVVLLAPILVSPYITSKVNYGHPLYPTITVDEERYPKRCLTRDFFIRNEDAARMGHFAAFMNAYISSDIVHAYYKRIAGIKDFNPWSRNWGQDNPGSDGSATPTPMWFKVAFCALFILLLFLGKGFERMLSIIMLLAVNLLPTEIIGYRRYVPWLLATSVFLLPLLVDEIKRKWLSYIAVAVLGIIFVRPATRSLATCASYIDRMAAINDVFSRGEIKRIYNFYTKDWALDPEQNKKTLGNLILLKRMVPEMASVEIVPQMIPLLPKDRSEAKSFMKDRFDAFYDYSCNVDAKLDLSRHSAHMRMLKANGLHKKLLAYGRLFFKAYIIDVPSSLYRACFISSRKESNQ